MTATLFTRIISKATTIATATQRQSVSHARRHFSNNSKMGLTKEVLKEGNGQKPTKGQEVSVHCTGYGKDRDLTKVFWCKLVKKEKDKQK
jgi:FKBP-type peptidyl-prolyl cis-trans isomerase